MTFSPIQRYIKQFIMGFYAYPLLPLESERHLMLV